MVEHRDQEKDEQWIREVFAACAPHEVVYVRPAYYDGGYEVRVGSCTIFLEYDVLDTRDIAWVERVFHEKKK